MNTFEYNSSKGMNYDQYFSFLQEKYGKPKKSYFSQRFKLNEKNFKNKQNLKIHHYFEKDVLNLNKPSIAMQHPFSFQKRENLAYCDLLEHLFLHILLCEEIIRYKEYTQEDLINTLDANVLELNDYFTTIFNKDFEHYKKIQIEKDLYLTLLKRLFKNDKLNKNYKVDIKKIKTILFEQIKKTNAPLFNEIINL